jgi:hypothetical protein
MTWVKLDDKANSHPKLRRVGADAAWLWTCGLCHCNAHATAGRIDKADLPALYAGAWTPRQLETLAKKLVAVGLWSDDGDHFAVHDYAEYQEEALPEQVAERREQARIRKRRSRERERLRTQEATVTRDARVTVTRDLASDTARGGVGDPPCDRQTDDPGASRSPGPARPDPSRSSAADATAPAEIEPVALVLGQEIARHDEFANIMSDPIRWAEKNLYAHFIHAGFKLDDALGHAKRGIAEAAADTPNGERPSETLRRLRSYVIAAADPHKRAAWQARQRKSIAPQGSANPAAELARISAMTAGLPKFEPKQTTP